MYRKQSEERIRLFTELNKILGFKVPTDGLLAIITKRWEIDISKLDRELSRNDYNYKHKEALYKDKPMSMHEYLIFKYGERSSEIVKMLFEIEDESCR